MDEWSSTWETAQVRPPQESGARKAWRRFRALPTKAQGAAWIVTAVVVVAALVGGPQGTDEGVVASAVENETAQAEQTPGPTPETTEDVREDPTDGATEESTAQPSPERAVEPVPAGWTVVNIVDGDTIDVRGAGGEERVRIIGIDTPERGECGFTEASAALSAIIQGKNVELLGGARDDRDRYDRLLRYVDLDGADAGLELVKAGWATARYDSRDGYGRHLREDAYVAADAATAHACAAAHPQSASQPEPQPAAPPASAGGPGTGPGGSWKNCTEARDNGAAPVHRGDSGYGTHLDGDNDGVGCE